MTETRYDTAKPPENKQDKIEQLMCMFPLWHSAAISKELERHNMKSHDYLREFVKITNAKGLKFSLLLHPEGNAFFNFVADFDQKLAKFPKCEIVNYIEYSFQDEPTFKDCIIFIFSEYVNQEQLIVDKFKEFYSLRAFI